jgi:hypothetical protein
MPTDEKKDDSKASIELTRKHSKALIELAREYFGEKNAWGFYIYHLNSGEGFFAECLMYRIFRVRFSLGDIRQGGVFGIAVYIGDWPVDLETLTDWDEGISLNFTREAVLKDLAILDRYLQWRMTDDQKKALGLLKG